MLDKLRSMAIFAKVVELGSFRRAAEALDLSTSVVSHHVAQLEKQLGVTLLYRSTRHLSTTNEGASLYEQCQIMVAAAESGLGRLSQDAGVLVGRLRIVAPGPFANGPFMEDVATFAIEHPQLQIRLEFDDRPRNLVQEGIDLAIRFGAPEDSSLVARQLIKVSRRIYAAPAYLAARGTPSDLQCLADHDWVDLGAQTQPTELWSGTDHVSCMPLRRRVVASSMPAAKLLAMRGLGLIMLPDFVVQEDLQTGQLVPVLPEWGSSGEALHALYPARRETNAAPRRFVEFLQVQMEAGLRRRMSLMTR